MTGNQSISMFPVFYSKSDQNLKYLSFSTTKFPSNKTLSIRKIPTRTLSTKLPDTKYYQVKNFFGWNFLGTWVIFGNFDFRNIYTLKINHFESLQCRLVGKCMQVFLFVRRWDTNQQQGHGYLYVKYLGPNLRSCNLRYLPYNGPYSNPL